MAGKEATVYVLDIGPGMREYLAPAHRILDMLLLDKMNLSRGVQADPGWSQARTAKKQDVVAVFLAGSPNRHFNDMELLSPGYDHIYQLWGPDFGMSNVHIDLVRQVRDSITLGSDNADLVETLVLAVDAISRHCGKYKYERRVVLITNGESPADAELASSVCQQAMDQDITIDTVVFGFSDPSQPASGPQRTMQVLKMIADATKGDIYDAADAVDAAGAPRAKQKSSRAYQRTLLTIGDPATPGSQVQFPVSIFLRTQPASAPRFLKFSKPAREAKDNTAGACGVATNTVYRAITDDGQIDESDTTEYEKDALIKAYRYGMSCIPVTDWEKELEAYKSVKMFEIIAFVDDSQVHIEQNMQHVQLILADQTADRADVKLSTLVNAMIDQNTIALARFVFRDGTAPRLVGLLPHVKPMYEGLLMIDLPFAEDYRQFPLIPLNFREPATSQKSAAESQLMAMALPKKFAPSETQLQVTASLITALDLQPGVKTEPDSASEPSNSIRNNDAGDDDATDDGGGADTDQQEEYLRPKTTVNPAIQSVWDAVEFRALHPTQPLPPRRPELLQQFERPAPVWKSKAQQVRAFDEAFPTKKVEPKPKRKAAPTNSVIGISGVVDLGVSASASQAPTQVPSIFCFLNTVPVRDIDSLLSRQDKHIRPARWKEDFQATISRADGDYVGAAIAELGSLAMAFANAGDHEQARDCLQSMRAGALELTAGVKENGEVEFNSFLKKLRIIDRGMWLSLTHDSPATTGFITQAESKAGMPEAEVAAEE
ncbi:ATP-dependent DNA helicase yku80 [Sorochytrium milnesiophthora]